MILKPDPLPSGELSTAYDEFNLEVPRESFPVGGMAARGAQAVVNSFGWADANPMLNLSSFMTTYSEPEALEVARAHQYTNYVDSDVYPQIFKLETQIVNWLHDLWNGPKGVVPYGAATMGSSEACMLAGLAHKWNWREARKRAGKDASHPNLVAGGSAQLVWHKFMRFFDVEPHLVPLRPSRFRLTAERLEKYVNENTICVVAIAGQTFTGEDDDFEEIHDWLDSYELRTGINIPMHIDAASGGFVNPFLYPGYKWDFRLPRVKSISTSGHKFGLVPPGLGWIVFKERKVFNEELVFYVNYQGGELPTASLNFSKGAAPIAVQAYLMLRLGREGFTRIMRHALDGAVHLRKRIMDSGYFDILNESQRMPVVALTLARRGRNFNEFDVSAKVREQGWILSACSLPPDAQQVRSLRIVVRPHLNLSLIDGLANDLIQACQHLECHGGAGTAPGFHGHDRSGSKC